MFVRLGAPAIAALSCLFAASCTQIFDYRGAGAGGASTGATSTSASAGGSGGGLVASVGPATSGSGATGGSGVGGGGAGGAGGSQGVTLTLHPSEGLDGDGFLSQPDLCGDDVIDAYPHGNTYQGIHVGRDDPCDLSTTYRAFLRFDLSDLSDISTIDNVELRLYYIENTQATEAALLFQVSDFGVLELGDWSIPVLAAFGPVIDPATPTGWITQEVTQQVIDAVPSGAIAFKLQYADEAQAPGGTSRWYGIVAVDDPQSFDPRLVVTGG